MGFRRRNYRLIWPEEHELHGLEVTVRGLPIGDLQVIAGLAPDGAVGSTAKDVTPLLKLFAKALVSWNFEDEDGTPVGTSLAELEAQDLRFLLPVIMAWVQEVSTVADPLPTPSGDGAPTDTVAPALIPMESLSPNL
jgi:hypothetical protein